MSQYLKCSSADLIDSIRENNEISVQYLLRKGIEVNARDNGDTGMTALHYAILLDNPAILQLLLEHGAYPDDRTHDGVHPIDMAFYLGKSEHVEVLLRYKARVDMKIFHLCQLDSVPPSMVEVFYRHVEARDRDKNGDSILHVAVSHGDVNGARILINRGAPVNDRTLTDGNTSLHLAAGNGDVACLRLLLTNGAKVNLRDEAGLTALHLLADAKTYEVNKLRAVQMLLDAGADVNMACNNGKTVLHCAMGHMSTEVCAILVKHVAKMQHKGAYLSGMNAGLIEESTRWSFYYIDCMKELNAMKRERLSSSRSLYDFLVEDSRHARDASALTAFRENKQYRAQFPIYYTVLRRNCNSAARRRGSMDQASVGLSVAMPVVRPDNIIMQIIMEFLTVEDLEALEAVGDLVSQVFEKLKKN